MLCLPKTQNPRRSKLSKLSTDSGILLLNKPKGVSSTAVVQRVKRILQLDKVGHCGTLDPLAQGLLILLFGRWTRRTEEFMNQPKGYLATLELGRSSVSGDLDSEMLEEKDPTRITAENFLEALAPFEGALLQTPPMHSALRYGGQRLYELARRGLSVPRAPRSVTIHKLEMLEWKPPLAQLQISCSRGTYVRTLVSDLGQHLGVGAVLVDLVRHRIGPFFLEEALSWEDLDNHADRVNAHVLAMSQRWLQHWETACA